MARRRIAGKRTPKLAKMLREYRRGRQWSDVARAMEKHLPEGSTGNRGTVRNYETQARAPQDMTLLWALCRVYSVDFKKIVEAMVMELLDKDPAFPEPSLNEEEALLVEYYRAAKDHRNSQVAMLAACEALAKAAADAAVD